MAGGSFNKNNGIIEGINVTPLVDIMLVLLVIFIVTAKVIVQPSLGLELPKASTGENTQVIFAVTLRADGQRLINQDLHPDDAVFVARAREQLAQDPKLHVVIQADRTVPYEKIVHTIDLLRQAGVQNIAFAVNDGEGASP